MTHKQLLKLSVGWGLALWSIGYVLSFILFFIVPPSLIGWVIAPIGTAITLWVLFRKMRSEHFGHYLVLSVAWTGIAAVLDYFFIVKALNPADGYYKPAVYLYYAPTFALPLFVGWWKKSASSSTQHSSAQLPGITTSCAMKVVIAGSASLPQEIEKWVAYWNGQPDHTVLNYPIAIPKDEFEAVYPRVHTKFFNDITSTDILFIANEEKRGIAGYIGAETFAELCFGLAQNLVYGKHISLILAHPPAKEVACYDEIVLWKKLGWITLL